MAKRATSIRLSDQDKAIIAEIQRLSPPGRNTTVTAVIRLALRNQLRRSRRWAKLRAQPPNNEGDED